MNVKLVTDKLLARMVSPRPCPICRRAVRAGQYVLHQRLDPARYADSTLMIHVACLRPIVERTPEDEADPSCVEQEYQQIRRMLAG